MSKYDSILKEKKVYQDPVSSPKKKKHFPYLLLDIILILIILIISYIIYYRTILAPDKIFLSDLSSVVTEYQQMLKYLPIEELTSDYYFEGNLSLDETKYNYSTIKNDTKFKVDLSLEEEDLSYYLDSGNYYLKLSNFNEDYIIMKQSNPLNNLISIKEKFFEIITKDNYIKKFYLDGTTPIVEVDLTLINDQINNLIKSPLKDQYKIIFTFKNNAFTNEIISLKASINNLTSNKRILITYKDGELTYSDDEKINLKFKLSQKNEDFTLKIYQNDILHSVLSGTKLEDSYQYLYQIIDKIYNLSLNINQTDTNYTYKLTSNIEIEGITHQNELILTLSKKENIILDSVDLNNLQTYASFTKEEKEALKQALNNIISPLRQLIKEYQQGI